MLLRSTAGSLLLVTLASAGPLSPDDVPEALRPWTKWVLRGQESAACPFPQGSVETPRCAWPGRLDLRLDDRSGQAAATWRVYAKEWVPLPGDARRWPQDVTVDGAPAIVTARNEVPGLLLRPGDHTVRASFSWDALPESLPIPPASGLISLTVRGKPVPFPLREADGRLWVQRAGDKEIEEEERLEILAHRLIVDEIPATMMTRIELRVSGKDREVVLGRAIPSGFIPMSLAGDLPARLESDGRLRAQIRPGEHVLELLARHQGPLSSVQRGDPGGPWPATEVWVFDARNHLRVVQVEGVAPVDPRQTTLPPEWHGLPAYLLGTGDTMRLTEKRRGDSDPPPDRLSLVRTMWLDHDGGGYTVRDEISGSLRRSFRLEMGDGTALGRVSVDGRNHLITRLRSDGPLGVELRQGAANLEAVSRIERRSSVPAVSWDHDFHEVGGTLRIPPGWRLLGVWGADRVPETWLMRWSLLDLFLVLVTAFAVGRLWGWPWGVVALCTIGLTITETDAPRWVWLAALAGEALVRLLVSGRIGRLVRLYRLAAWVVLVLVTVPFVVAHLRGAIYPAVGPAAMWEAEKGFAVREKAVVDAPAAAVPEAPPVPAEAKAPRREAADEFRTLKSAPPSPASFAADVDPGDKVQTGPGLPRWSWDSATIQFSGPVERAQSLRLLLSPPWFNLLLAFLRVALLAALIVRVIGRVAVSRGAASAAAALLLCLLPSAALAQFPPSDMLEELRQRLTERPECAPRCASAPRMLLEAEPESLRVRLEVDALGATAVPLPGAEEWPPERVLLDGKPARALLFQEGSLWLAVEPGRHQVLLEGRLPRRSTVRLALPPLLRPRQVQASARGWTIEGVHEDGLSDDSLILTRLGDDGDQEAGGLEPRALPPFVSVERTLRLGLTWEVDTTVRRLTPPGVAVALRVPLLESESVTTPDVRTEGDHVLVSLQAAADAVTWRSTIPVRKAVSLTAREDVAWTEVWRLDASAVWHVGWTGIPPIQPLSEAGRRVPEWRPWPGEALSLLVSRPEGGPGSTLTVESATIALRPGERATDARLDMTVRSSRGAEHTVVLPPGAQLESVAIDGVPQPIRQQQRRVTFPVVPREQEVQISWREPRGIGVLFKGSEVDLGAPGTNVNLHIEPVLGRWALLLGGPRQGPAVLFWSLLLALLLVAWGISRTRMTPLGPRPWMLLLIGLSQVPIWAAAVVVGWLLLLGARKRWPGGSWLWFDARQLLIVAWTAAALAVLLGAIHQGLLGDPDMQVAGNGSTATHLRWFADRTGPVPPRPWILSAPVLVYRLAMLFWALWIAAALLRWLRWGWGCFAEGGIWRAFKRASPPA